jgi:hypothetical protein
MTQRAAAPTAVMAADIANAVAMTLTHSQIDTVQFQSGSIAALAFLGNRDWAARRGGAWCHSFYRQRLTSRETG